MLQISVVKLDLKVELKMAVIAGDTPLQCIGMEHGKSARVTQKGHSFKSKDGSVKAVAGGVVLSVNITRSVLVH